MAVTVTFDDRLRQRLGDIQQIDVDAKTVHAALMLVSKTYPVLHLLNCDGELRSIVRFAKNGSPVSVTAEVADGDTIALSIA